MHRDRMRQASHRVRDHFVTWKGEQMFARGCCCPVESRGHAALLSTWAIASARRLMPSSIFRVITNAAGSINNIVNHERVDGGMNTRFRESNRVRPMPSG